MKIMDPLQDFMTPLFDDFEFRLAHLLQILAQTSSRDHLSDEIDLVLFLADPSSDESDDVLVMQFFD